MTWQISMLLVFGFSIAQALWRRIYSQKSELPGRVPPALSYLLGVLPLGIIVGLGTGNVWVNWSIETVLILAAMASGIGVFTWLAFEASKQLGVTLFQTLFQLHAVTAIVFGWLLLSEGLNGRQVFGAILLIFGAVLAAQSYKTKEKTRFVGSAVFLGALASISLGIGIVAEKSALSHMSLGAYYIIGYAAQVLAVCLIASRELAKLKWGKVKRSDWWGSGLMGILSAMTGFFFIYALNTADNVSLVTVVGTFQMPLIAAAGYLFLKEREIGWKLASAVAVGFAGLILTAL